MKQSFILLALLFLSFVNVNAQQKIVYKDDYLVKVGDIAPEFIVNEAGGKSYSLSSLKGKVVMLQFTASWCSVCRKEMSFIENEIWKKGNEPGLAVIGIDRDEPPEKVLKFKREMGITYPLALDPGAEIFGLYALKEAGVTRNVIIDRSGKIIFLTRLFDRKEFDMMKKIIFSELRKK
jgi:peroxiredoxin